MNLTFLLLLFLLIAFAFTFLILLNFRKNLKKVTRYTREISEGRFPALTTHDMSGPFHELVKNIDETASRLKDELRSATEEKNRILSILESMAEGVAVIGPDEKLLVVNSVLGGVLGLKKEELTSRYFWEIFRDSEINQMIEKSLRERVMLKMEHSILLSEKVFDIQTSPVFGNKEFLGVIAVFHDVTKLKELENVRSEFVANVSHELKTPLTSIMGFVETLKEGALEDPENRLKFLQIIEEHSKKLHHLIEELLLLSKVESGKQALKKEAVDLAEMFHGVLESFGPSLKAKKIRTDCDCTPKFFVINADAKYLEQAFSNIVDNAIKYNNPDGRIFVRGSYEGDTAKIEISDTGIGIPEADISRIFERFYRVDKSRSRESGGTGLGLSIVKHIIERHNGTIHVQSQLQKGTTFIVILPRE